MYKLYFYYLKFLLNDNGLTFQNYITSLYRQNKKLFIKALVFTSKRCPQIFTSAFIRKIFSITFFNKDTELLENVSYIIQLDQNVSHNIHFFEEKITPLFPKQLNNKEVSTIEWLFFLLFEKSQEDNETDSIKKFLNNKLIKNALTYQTQQNILSLVSGERYNLLRYIFSGLEISTNLKPQRKPIKI